MSTAFQNKKKITFYASNASGIIYLWYPLSVRHEKRILKTKCDEAQKK